MVGFIVGSGLFTKLFEILAFLEAAVRSLAAYVAFVIDDDFTRRAIVIR